MFDGLLPTNINAYATTAANDSESSWGTYCPPDDYVNGKPINSCLGDLYSVNWMEDSDANNLNKETLGTQFANIMVLDSQVSEFLHVRLGGLLLDSGELGAQGLFVQVVSIRIFHPVDRVKISQARVDGLSVHVVIRRAVGSPRRFGVIGSSSGISIDVGRQKAIEHASTLAGFDVDHKLIIEA